MPRTGSLDSFGSILDGLAKRLGLESRLLELRLQHEWRDIVGEPIGSHTWPAQIRFKKLSLVVRNSVWLQQLTFLKPSLLAKLNEAVGTELIKEIVLRVGEIPVPAATPSDGRATDGKSPETEAVRAEAAGHVSAIQDPGLRERFTSAILKYPSQAPLPPATGRSRGL
jgi:predicted nucleic acid-binding Zn ribbon protein